MHAIRLQRFKAFEDTGWIAFKPITLLFGYNSAGKSSILQSLLMLKQSIQNPALEVPFVFLSDKGVDLGAFEDVIYQHKVNHEKPMIISLKIFVPKEYVERLMNQQPVWSVHEEHISYGTVETNQEFDGNITLEELIYSMEISYNQRRRFVSLKGFYIKDSADRCLLQMRKKGVAESERPEYYSDFFDLKNAKVPLTWYNFLPLIKNEGSFEALSKITEIMLNTVKTRLIGMVNIGPVRAKPERTMLFSGEKPASVGIGGEDSFKILYSDKYSANSKNLEEKVNNWLYKYNYRFEWKMLKSNLGQFILNELSDNKTKVEANIVDVGFGLSQVLPVAVQLYVMEKNGMLLIEQPEIHLHSKAQADLADLFIDAITSEKKYLLVETHSENLLLRLRRRIAENANLKSDEVGLYYISHRNGASKVSSMNINYYGDIAEMPKEFKDFFVDDMNEIMSLHEAKGRKKAFENKE